MKQKLVDKHFKDFWASLELILESAALFFVGIEMVPEREMGVLQSLI